MKLFLVIILLVFLFPVLNISGIPIRIEDLIFLGIIIGSRKGSLMEDFSTPRKSIFIKILLFFFISNLISLSLAIIKGYTPVIKDLNSIFFVFRNIVILCAGLTFGKTLEISFNKLMLILSIGPLISSMVSMIQYFNLFGLGSYTYLLFGSEDKILYGITRVVGIFGNPNYAAFFQVIGFSALLGISQLKYLSNKVIVVSLLSLSFISVLITFSRTGLIAAVLSLLAYLFLKKKIKLLALMVLCFFVIVLPNISSLISNTRYSVISQDNKTFDVTMGGRANLIWAKKIEKFFDSPVFGIGPAKGDESNTSFSTTLYDSSIFYLLVTSGVVGCLIILLFLFYEIRFFYYLRNTFLEPVSTYFMLLNISIAIFFITSDLIANPIFASFFYFTVGTCISYSLKALSLNDEDINIENNESASVQVV